MSDLALTQQGADLLSLAEEFGIDLSNDMSAALYTGGNSKFTSYLRPKNVRSIFDAHKLDGIIKWTELDFEGNPTNRTAEILYKPDPNGGEPREVSGIMELRGVIVNYQQRDELRYFDGEKTQTLCSVIGYTQADGTVVRDLPSTPYGMKHSFVKDPLTKKWSVDTTKPNEAVETLGLVGFRGERPTSCAECIRCGQSTEVIAGIGEKGADKTIACEPRGKLYLAVFQVSAKTKVKQDGGVKGKAKYVDTVEVLDIKDLVDLEGESIGDFILVEVPMSKSSIKGNYVKGENGKKDEEKSVEGYESYRRNLLYTYTDERSPLRNPSVHITSLTFKKNSYAPTYQANFASLGVASIEWFKTAMLNWKEEVPPRTVEELEVENLQSIQVDGTINIASTEVSSMKTIQQPVEEEEEDIDLDEIPF